MLRRVLPALMGSALLCLAFASPSEAARTVLFDQAHDERFLPDGRKELDLGSLGDAFREGGFEVSKLTGPVTDKALKDVSAFVVSGPFRPFSAEEIKAVKGFVERGGNLAVMIHIAPPASQLLAAFDILVSPGVLKETGNLIGGSDIDFSVKKFLPVPLFQDIAEFEVHGGWALLASGRSVKGAAFTSEGGWVDLDHDGRRNPETEPTHVYSVAAAGEAGRGKVAVFGDDAIFQNKFLAAPGNLQLARNLVAWFTPGAR